MAKTAASRVASSLWFDASDHRLDTPRQKVSSFYDHGHFQAPVHKVIVAWTGQEIPDKVDAFFHRSDQCRVRFTLQEVESKRLVKKLTRGQRP